MTIPDIDDTIIRGWALTLACIFETKDPQRAMAVADSFREYIDPIGDDSDQFTFTPDKAA